MMRMGAGSSLWAAQDDCKVEEEAPAIQEARRKERGGDVAGGRCGRC